MGRRKYKKQIYTVTNVTHIYHNSVKQLKRIQSKCCFATYSRRLSGNLFVTANFGLFLNPSRAQCSIPDHAPHAAACPRDTSQASAADERARSSSGAATKLRIWKSPPLYLGTADKQYFKRRLALQSRRRSYRDSLPINRASFPVMASWGTDRKQTLPSQIVPPSPVPSSCKFAAVSAER